MLSSGKSVTNLDLADKKLTALPDELFELKELKSLVLRKNPISRLDDRIGELTGLEKLDLEKCELEELPDWIYRLKNLKELKLDSNFFSTLPECFGKLKNLRTCSLNYNKGIKLPESFGQLTNLLSLEMYGCSETKAIDFPDVICKLKSLKKLDVSSNAFRKIPAELASLTELEELNLNSGLCYLKEIPDLSSLKQLKVLHANGNCAFVTRPSPRQELLKSFFAIKNLEELGIDRHGKNEEIYEDAQFKELLKNVETDDKERLADYKARFKVKEKNKYHGNIWKGIQRDALQPGHLEGIENLTNLKRLDLSFNHLKKLPEGIFRLKNLEFVDLEYNNIPVEDIQRIATTNPNCRTNARKIKTRVDVDDENFKKVNSLIKSGSKKMQKEKYKPAINDFEKALSKCKPGKKYSDYDELYAHYGIVYSLSYLIGSANSSREKQKLYKQLLEVGGKILHELVPEGINIWHFTEEGAFQEECIRYAGNMIGWFTYVKGSPDKELEKFLPYVKRAVQYIDNVNHYYIFDTQVRMLLQLDRTDEAYKIVDRVLRTAPRFDDFQDFKTNKEFLNWQKENT